MGRSDVGAVDLHSDGVHEVLGYNVHPCIAAVCYLSECFRRCRQRIRLRQRFFKKVVFASESAKLQ